MIDKSIYPTKLTLNGVEYPMDIADAVSIDECNLNEEFLRHPGLFAFIATAYEISVREENRASAALSRLEASLNHRGRMEAIQAGLKSTDKMAENYVKTQQEHVELSDALIEIEHQVGLLKAAKEAMIHRKDALIQLASTQRQEHASDISLKQSQVKNVVNKR
jgi:hypothetical protein